MATAPYDIVNSILNAARFRVNDSITTLVSISGNILDETAAATQQAFNNAYRRFQDACCDEGVERFEDEIIIPNIPIVVNLDPSALCSISWFEFFDGATTTGTPVLPQNLILPLWMSERPSVTSGVNPFIFPRPEMPNMKCYTDGLPMFQKQQRNRCWEWKKDTIFFPGALINVDFRIRFRAYLADIVDGGGLRWFEQPLPMMRCQDPMSLWVAYEFAMARAADGDAAEQMMMAAKGFRDEAIEATKKFVNRDIMKNERTNVRRLPYGGGSRGQGNRSGYYR